uniref:Reverse transcriptase domain-containing protein n=1 Tax=Tanacetum cinerariifolium TaxID=118510 RepID=A0A6L2NJS1_TANCI|nr:reverse transcriptase domain-containing protein [Tanacetum cinerariifolium]
MEALSEGEDSAGGHWKSRSKRQKSSVGEEDLSQPWVCEEIDPFTLRIHYFDFLKTRMPSHIKTYDGNEDPKDHLKIFQAAAKAERWVMPTWCHMFNSTLTRNARVWFDDLSQESIDSYDDLKKVFLENYLQQKKCIKDLVKIHNIKQRDGQSTEEFVRRYKLECRDVKGASECMKISGFMHGITNPELIKCLHDEIPKDSDFIPTPREEDGTKGPMVIEAEIGGHFVHRMYVDGGSFSKILYEHCFNMFRLKVKSQMVPTTTPLVRFSGKIIWPPGQISLLVKIGDEENSTSAWMNFIVVRSPSPYNGIIGRLGVRRIQEFQSTAHEMLNFPVIGETVTLRSGRIIPLECTMVSGPGVPQLIINQVTEEKIQVAIHPEYPKQTIAIGSTLTEEGRKELCGLLRRNLDIFAWKLVYMFGVPRHIAEHRLIIHEGCLPARKNKMRQAPERNMAIYEENYPTAPEEKEELIIYLAVAKEAISEVLMTERDGKQMPIYFVSRVLQGPEINYTLMKKLILALIFWKREESRQQSRKQKAKLRWKKYHNARFHNISFKPGDLVYRNNEASHAEDRGKLGPKWERPYEVTGALGKGAYKLRDRSGNILPRTWNVCNLKKCYVHEM